MVKVIDARNIARAPSARDPGVRIADVGGAVASAARGLEQAANYYAAKDEEVKRKQQQIEDVRFVSAYESEYRLRSAAIVEGMKSKEADADYVPTVTERGAELHSGIMAQFDGKYSPSDMAKARTEALRRDLYTTMRINARSNHNTASLVQAFASTAETMDNTALAVASAPDLDVLVGALDEIDVQAARLQGMADPAKLEELRLEKREDATVNYFLGLIRGGDLDLAEEQIRSNDFDGDLGGGTRKSALLNQIVTERAQRARRAQVAFDKAENDASAAVALGLSPDTGPMEDALSQMPRGTVGAARSRINAVTAAARQYDTFGALPTAHRQSVLADIEARLNNSDSVTRAQVDLFEGLERIDKRAADQQKEDATVLVTNAGRADALDPSITPDITNPEYAAGAVRLAEATTAAVGVASDVQTLPRPAYEQVVEGLGSREDAKRGAALTFLSQLNDDTRTNVLDSLGSGVRPAVRVAIGVAGRDADLAIRVARGDALRSESGGTSGRIMPKNDAIAEAITNLFGEAFSNAPQLQQDLVQAALSLYALRANADEPDSADIEGVLTQLVPAEQIQDINGRRVYLAPRHAGFDGAAFKDAVYKAGSTSGATPLELSTDLSNRAGLALTESDLTAPEIPDPEFAERVGVAYNPGTGRVVDLEGYRLVQVIDADGAPVELAELSEAQLQQQIAPGVYVPHVESSRGTETAPLRVIYESEDGLARLVTGFAISLDKMNALSQPTGRVPAKAPVSDDEEPLKPLDHVKHGTRRERFDKANRQFGERFDRNFNRTLRNLEDAVRSGEDETNPAVEDLNHLRSLERGTAQYLAALDLIKQKYGGVGRFINLLREAGALN